MKTPTPLTDEQVVDLLGNCENGGWFKYHAFARAIEAARDAQWVEMLAGQDPVAMRYDFDGYGWQYIDSGSGSNWATRHPGAEPLYTCQPDDTALLQQALEALTNRYVVSGAAMEQCCQTIAALEARLK